MLLFGVLEEITDIVCQGSRIGELLFQDSDNIGHRALHGRGHYTPRCQTGWLVTVWYGGVRC